MKSRRSDIMGNIAFIKYDPQLDLISDYLNHKLVNHKDYIDNSFVFICGLKESKLLIDIIDIDIDPALSNEDQCVVLDLMSTIVCENHEVIEYYFDKIQAKETCSSLPAP